MKNNWYSALQIVCHCRQLFNNSPIIAASWGILRHCEKSGQNPPGTTADLALCFLPPWGWGGDRLGASCGLGAAQGDVLPSPQGITGLCSPLLLPDLKLSWSKACWGSPSPGTQGDSGWELPSVWLNVVWGPAHATAALLWAKGPWSCPWSWLSSHSSGLTRSVQAPSSMAGVWESFPPTGLASPLSSDLMICFPFLDFNVPTSYPLQELHIPQFISVYWVILSPRMVWGWKGP